VRLAEQSSAEQSHTGRRGLPDELPSTHPRPPIPPLAHTHLHQGKYKTPNDPVKEQIAQDKFGKRWEGGWAAGCVGTDEGS